MSTLPSNENATSDFLQLEPIGVQPSATEQPQNPAAGENWDVDKELTSLFELMGSHTQPLERTAKDKPSEALKTESQRLLAAIAETKEQLAQLQQNHQEKIAAIDQGVSQAEQLQQRTEQLAKYSKLQVRQLQEMLQSFDTVRQEIVTALDRFGSYDRIALLVQNIQVAEQALHAANEHLQTHQSGLHQSLKSVQSIQTQIEQRGQDIEQNLLQKQGELKNLLLAIREDRERVVALETSIEDRLAQADRLHQDLGTIQTSITEKSTAMANNLTDLQQNFTGLSESVQHEKQQFYQLTAEMINKTDAMRSQFAELAKQVSKDWESIQSLQFKMEDISDRFDGDNQAQVSQLTHRYDEIVASWDDVKRKQQGIQRFQQRQKTWLQVLSAVLGSTALLVILLAIKVLTR